MRHSNLIRRRQQHIGVLSDDMWSAHDRRGAGATTPPTLT
jgi:hypothetical protein